MNSADSTHPGLVVVAICGSRRGSQHLRRALEVALHGAEEVGAEARPINLHGYQLGFCGKEDGSPQLEDVVRLRREVGRRKGSSSGRRSITGASAGSSRTPWISSGSRNSRGR